jgi:hypothetical protein
VTVLQTFPGIVFLCDQTELAVERGVAEAVLVRPHAEPDSEGGARGFSRAKVIE